MKNLLCLILGALLPVGAAAPAPVYLLRLPDGGLQPQARVDAEGGLHLLYFAGEPAAGDLFYLRRASSDTAFSAPLRVNSQPGTAIAVGTVRGGHLALGRGGRPQVAWMSARRDEPGMFYARLADSGDRFEPQRNVTCRAFGLDGGGSVAADTLGNVYVAWHAGEESEATRRVWVAHSADDGRTFAPEEQANPRESGACGCCGIRALATDRGDLYLLYRAATQMRHRDMTLLFRPAGVDSTLQRRLHEWDLLACPMSTCSLSAGPEGVLAAWETDGQVYWTRLGQDFPIVYPPGEGKGRKHPVVVAGDRGETLLVWTEGTGWQRGGDLVWQRFDAQGRAEGEVGRVDDGIPVWGCAAAAAGLDGGFTILY